MAWVLRLSCVTLALFLGCGRVASDTGGETNWLTCVVDEDCPDGIECQAGYCGPPPGSSGGTSAGGQSEGLPENDGLPCNLTTLMSKSCWGIGCHGANTPAAMLDMESPDVATRLVDFPASHTDILDGSVPNCLPGELRVDSANPENSLILRKVYGTQSCGSRMPVAPRTVTPADVECLRAWVYSLAGKEPPPVGTGATIGTAGMAGTGGTGGTTSPDGGAAGGT